MEFRQGEAEGLGEPSDLGDLGADVAPDADDVEVTDYH
jgi:hypothetical protein